MISKELVLLGIRTYRTCYKEEKQSMTPEAFETAMGVLDLVEGLVKTMPEGDSKGLVQGEWKMTGEHFLPYQCSVCEIKNDGRTNFCPNCGALMEAKNETVS